MANLTYRGSSPVRTTSGAGVNRQNILKVHKPVITAQAFFHLMAYCTEEHIEQIERVLNSFKAPLSRALRNNQPLRNNHRTLYFRITGDRPIFGAQQLVKVSTHQLWTSSGGWKPDLGERLKDGFERLAAIDAAKPPP